LVFYDISVFAELISKSTSILLEDEGGKTSREEHCYTILLLTKLTVWCGNHHKLKASHKMQSCLANKNTNFFWAGCYDKVQPFPWVKGGIKGREPGHQTRPRTQRHMPPALFKMNRVEVAQNGFQHILALL